MDIRQLRTGTGMRNERLRTQKRGWDSCTATASITIAGDLTIVAFLKSWSCSSLRKLLAEWPATGLFVEMENQEADGDWCSQALHR